MKYLFSYCCNYKGTENQLPDCELDGERLISKLKNYKITSYKQGSPQLLVDFVTNINQVVKPDDTVLIQFSGHGSQYKVPSTIEKDNYLETLVFWDGYNYSLLSDKTFIKLTDSIKCKTIVIFDSCYSGGFNALVGTDKIIRSTNVKGELFELELNPVRSTSKKCYLMACAEKETAQSTGNGGLMTNSILEATKDSNKTINQVYTYSVNYCKGKQTPQLLLVGIAKNTKIF